MTPPALILLFHLAGRPAEAAVPVDFAHVRDVSGPERRAVRLAAVRLDAALLAATRPGFPDLRVFDGEHREIPFLIEPLVAPQERVGRQPVAARIGEIRELAGNRFEVRCDLEPGAPAATAVEIRTPLRDFIRHVRVVGSADGQFWQPLAEAEIYDYSRFLNMRRTTVSLPANECRTFILEVTGVSAERAEPFVRLVEADGQDSARAADMRQTPFQIGGIGFWQTAVAAATDAPILQEWPPAGVEMGKDRAARTTEFILDARRAPLTQVELESPVRDFNRLVTVLVPDGERWRTVADGIVTRISVPEFATNDLVVRFPEQRVDRLRVVVQHADAPAVKFTGIRAFGPSVRLVWIAEPAARYRLAYGSDLVEADGGDAAPIRAALANGHEPEPWQLAPAAAFPEAAATEKTGGPGRRWAFWGAVLVLAAGAWGAAARVRKKTS
ncbi:MAG: DUF3999 family protein [Kiritimatiellia bacterium]